MTRPEQLRVAFLGPHGTFSEQAALLAAPDAQLLPFPTITAAAQAQQQGDADRAVLPYENSIGGGVGETHDFLLHHHLARICGDVVIPIEHCLILHPDADAAHIDVIHSHPQALNQCQRYLARYFPNARTEAAASTVEAARAAVQHGPGAAAIAPRRAAQLTGGLIAQAGIEDDPHNRTRFIVVADHHHPPTGHDRTTVLFTTPNQPGALVRVLLEFLWNSINLTRLESRPRPGRYGDYMFFVDLDGHQQDEPVASACRRIASLTEELRIMGSYPNTTDP